MVFNNSILLGAAAAQGGGFYPQTIEQSLKFNDDDSQYLNWTPAAAGNRKTWTWSCWLKRGNLTGNQMQIFSAGGTNGNNAFIVFEADNTLLINQWTGFSSDIYLKTNQVFRDVSSFYNIVLSFDTTQATASDRIKVWVNGEQVTSFSTATYPSQNFDTRYNSSEVHALGCRSFDNVVFFDGYLSDIHFIDGQALDPTSFGEFKEGVWVATSYSGTYGTNGFHLTFADDVVSEGFNTVTYRGTGATQSISGLGFEPDFVWIKGRNVAGSPLVYDSVRGATKYLQTNSTSGEGTGADSQTSFDSDGFSVGADSSTTGVNNSGTTYVGWAWDAGSGSPVSNTDGSITSTVKANPSYGFSIVSYTGNGTAGATVGHGIATPDMIIVKDRDAVQSWRVYHPDVGATKTLSLNETSAAFSDSSIWNNTAPTSSVFSLGNGGSTNGSGRKYIAYCFNSVAGYSSIGSYSGTGSGVTVNCGFRPAFIMIKATNLVEGWAIIDGTRDTINPRNKVLKPNSSNAEVSGSQFNTDFTDTGFVMNGTDDVVNASGGTYIYMAFADTRDAAFWRDVSGNNNNWTPNNLDYRDSLPDSPTNNFATFNALEPQSNSYTFSEGNLKVVSPVSGYPYLLSTLYVSSGKWYGEFLLNSSNGYELVGIATKPFYGSRLIGFDADAWGYANWSGQYLNNNSLSSYGNTYTTGDIIGVAVDLDNNYLYFSKNGVWQNSGNPASGASGTGGINISSVSGTAVSMGVSDNDNGASSTFTANFGQDSTFSGAEPIGAYADDNGKGLFQYAVPSGFLSLCSDNLPEVTVGPNSAAKPIDQFETILYTGNGGTQHIGSGGVQHPVDVTTIDNSLRFNDDDSAYLARTPASAGNRKTWTWSGWVKRGNFSQNFLFSAGADSNNRVQLSFEDYTSDNLSLEAKSGGSTQALIVSTATYRDPSAWYHVVIAVDTTEATSTDRIKFYVDGSQVTDLQQTTYPSQNADLEINKAIEHNIGKRTYSTNYYDGYMADVYFIDGQALTPSSFGQYGSNGYWIPKAVTGLTYGTNGFSLDFSDNSTATALGTDGSGNGNDWTPANIAVSDQMLDSPTQNYAVLNPLANAGSTFSEGNLKISFSNDGSYNPPVETSTFTIPSSGKWYFEGLLVSSTAMGIGVQDNTDVKVRRGSVDYGVYYLDSGNIYTYVNGTDTNVDSSPASYTTGDIIGVAYNADTNSISWYKNGVLQTSYTPTAGYDFTPAYYAYASTVAANFGQDSTFAGNKTAGGNTDANGEGDFAYALPAGYLALNNNNIPEERGINSPDLVWIKERNGSKFP
jgi:hypothetical protein